MLLFNRAQRAVYKKNKMYAGTDGFSTGRKLSGTDGFSTVELVVVVLVIIVLIALLLPAMNSIVSKTRLSNVMQDAAGIGMAVETMKIQGRFDHSDTRLLEIIYYESGLLYTGHISDLRPDGSFIYSKTDGGVTYRVRYDSETGSVEEAA